VSLPVSLSVGDLVQAAPTYEVTAAGVYQLLELVPVRRRLIDTAGPIAAFLAASVVGIDPSEVPE
jgi:hypothetical protein